MKTRFVYVSNENRIEALYNELTIDEGFIRQGNYLFLLSNLSEIQYEILKKINKDYQPLIQIVHSKNNLIFKIIPEQLLLDSLQKYSCQDHDVVEFLKKVVNYFTMKPRPCWKIGQSCLDFNKKPVIMGILNVTPDSFSDGGLYTNKNKAIDHALEMIEEGADIIDIGGESTRPGAERVSVSEELQRVIPVIEGIKKDSNVFISIDTYKSEVANQAINAGAHIINDVSGTVFDSRMKSVIEEKKCPVILMHIQGTPKVMQVNPAYKNLHDEVYGFLQKRTDEIEALNNGRIIIDPGIGFGKTVSDNLKLLRDIKDFTFIDKPIMIGVSRKSFIGKILKNEIGKRLIGGLTSEIYSYLNGADILRVHQVHQIAQVKTMLNNILAA